MNILSALRSATHTFQLDEMVDLGGLPSSHPSAISERSPGRGEIEANKKLVKENAMSFFCRLSRRHYWSTPHRSEDRRLVQVCYECGAERPARELHNEIAAESLNQSIASARIEMARLSEQQSAEIYQRQIAPEKIAVGQGRTRRFIIVR